MEEIVREALRQAVRRAGSQRALAESARMTQSRISDYLNGRFRIGNITLNTLCRLFPGMRIRFFSPEKGACVDMEARGGGGGGPRRFFSGEGGEWVELRELERRIRRCDHLTPEERLNFLNFLDEEM
mgnify:FL=1